MAKLKLGDIIQEVESCNWKLISDQYTNLDAELEFKCPEGHKVFTSLKKWRRTKECPICSKNPFSTKNVVSIPKVKGKYRVLAIDDATHKSGWSIFDDSLLIQHGIFSTNDSDPTPKRIMMIKQWIASMIENWKPDIVVIEDIQLQDHSGTSSGKKVDKEGPDNSIGITTFKVLAHLQGVLINYFTENNVEYTIVPPATWRSYCKINGRSKADKKTSAILKVKEWYDISLSNDAAEAICLGKYIAEAQSNQRKMIQWE